MNVDPGIGKEIAAPYDQANGQKIAISEIRRRLQARRRCRWIEPADKVSQWKTVDKMLTGTPPPTGFHTGHAPSVRNDAFRGSIAHHSRAGLFHQDCHFLPHHAWSAPRVVKLANERFNGIGFGGVSIQPQD